MNGITVKEEENIIDLTDDPPYGASTAAPDIEFVGETRAQSRPSFSRRKKLNNPEVVIVEDEVPAVVDNVPPIPEVACHFFYPSEEDGGVEGGGYDPLAPIPEWVDCSTLHSEQVSVDDELPVLESLPEPNATSFAFVDPLSVAESIKTEPGTEIDVKPSLAQLSRMASAEQNIECSRLKNFDCVEKTNPLIKRELLNDGHAINSVSNKRKNSHDIDLNSTLPPKKLKTGCKVGPKCAQFRQKGKKMSTNNPNIKWTNPPNNYVNTTISPKPTNTTRKVGPKCAKFRLKERKTTTELYSEDLVSRDKTHPQNEEMEQNIVVKPAVVSIGPKLPLPQCFQRKQSLSQEMVRNTKYEFADKSDSKLDNNFDKDHIVLKIYTCFKCNHKCTDPLFHEEHVNFCSVKRRSKSLNLPLQDFNKQNGFYKCEICSFKFKNQENLSNHLNQHGVKGFICHICQLTFITLNQLNQHTVGDHKNLEKVFSCNTCEYSSQSVSHLKDHMIKHNTDKHLFCSSCRHNFEDTEEIERHRQVFHRKVKIKSVENNATKQIKIAKRESMNISKDTKATIVTAENKEQSEGNKAFNTKINEDSENRLTTMSSETKCQASLLTHFESQIIKRNGKYHCNGCRYKFVHLKNLIKHKKHHLRNKPFSCCQGSFVSLSYVDFSKHVKENHCKFFKFTCSMCPDTFTYGLSLNEHMVKHVNDGLYCYQCRKNMENVDAYRSHISKMHANMSIAKYTCIECSFSTPFQHILKKHLTRHSRNKIQSETLTHAKCNEAEVKQTIKVSQTKKSEKNIATFDLSHDQLKPDLSASTSNCTFCSLKLSSTAALQEHIKYEHEKGRSIMKTDFENEGFRCNKCTFKCSQTSMFIEHVKKGHTKRKFICNICRSDFAFLKLYLNHMKNHAACAVVYSCNECRFTSRKEPIFAKHMRTHALKCCPLCDYKTLRCDSFKTHLETIHTVENEYPSSWSTNPQSFENTSAVETKGNFSETLDSTLNNDSAKHHACCFCIYKTTNICNLRRHMAVHFNKKSNPKNEKCRNSVSKPSLTVERWKSKTLPRKTAQRGVPKVSQQSGKVRNGFTLLYCCTQCEYKKKNRKSVAQHLLGKHNIKGAVRNCTIKKVYVKVPPTENTDAKTDCENGELKKNTQSLESTLSLVSNQNESVLNDSMNVSHTVQKSTEYRSNRIKNVISTTSVLWKCSSCDLQKLSLLAQLQHKKYGHIGFWRRSFSCKICGLRYADKANLAKHLKWKHVGIKSEHQQSDKEEMQESKEEISRTTDKLGSNAVVTDKQNLIVNKCRRKRTVAIVKCPECNIESFSAAAQSQHSKLGHDAFWDRYFSCDICEMRFLNKGALGVHKLTHKTKFSSSNCNSFVSLKLKELHKQTWGGLREVAVKSEATSPNRSCLTEDKGNGIRDLNSDEEDNYVCGECDFVTTNVIEFSTHMFIHSGIPDD